MKIEDTLQNYIIYAEKITYLRNEERIITEGNSKALDNIGQVINADNFTYDKDSNILNAKGNVIIEDTIKNYTFNANDITYFKNEEKIITKGTTKADINSKYI